ncbi:MAG: ATP-binding cassette domain-containing protein [Longimicrobiales bacterium]
MSEPDAVLLRTAGLTRRFGDQVAVDRLDIVVARGELFGLVGPDGAGKTTTLRMLAGVLPPSAGDAWIGGLSVREQPESVKPRLAYMAQRFGLYEDLTVRENIDFYASLYHVPRSTREDRLERLYAFSGLGPFERRLAGALSGGMKQKLSLCCALIHRPELLLLDEPTFGVDPISRRDLWLILHEMIADGVTILVSTAYMDEAERCDRVALLDHGRVLATAAPAALQQTLPGQLLAVQTTEPRRARDVLRAAPGVRRAVLFGNAVHVLLQQHASAAGAAEALTTAGVPIDRMEPIAATLEDIFIERVATTGQHA